MTSATCTALEGPPVISTYVTPLAVGSIRRVLFCLGPTMPCSQDQCWLHVSESSLDKQNQWDIHTYIWFIGRNWPDVYGAWKVWQPAIWKPHTWESWWQGPSEARRAHSVSAHRGQAKADVLAQESGRESKGPLPLPSASVQALSRLDEAPPLQRAICSVGQLSHWAHPETRSCTSRNTVQSGHPMPRELTHKTRHHPLTDLKGLQIKTCNLLSRIHMPVVGPPPGCAMTSYWQEKIISFPLPLPNIAPLISFDNSASVLCISQSHRRSHISNNLSVSGLSWPWIIEVTCPQWLANMCSHIGILFWEEEVSIMALGLLYCRHRFHF